MKKRCDIRGLSDIVSTLIILLLAMVSIGIVWVDFDNFVVYTYDSSVSGIPRGNEFSLDGRILELPY